METVTLYQFEISPFCEKIRRALDYKRIPYLKLEVSLVNRKFLVAKTGGTKVPVVRYGAEWIGESNRICRWLDEGFTGSPVCPRDPSTGASNAIVESWADEALARSLMPMKWLTGRNSHAIMKQSQQSYARSTQMRLVHYAARRVILNEFKQKAELVGRKRLPGLFAEHLDLLDGLIAAKKFIFGDHPFSADFAAYGMLKRLEGLQGFEIVEKRKGIMRMMRAIDAIPTTAVAHEEHPGEGTAGSSPPSSAAKSYPDRASSSLHPH